MSTIAIDDKEYNTDDMTPEQQLLVNRLVIGARLLEEAEHKAGSLRLAQQAITQELKTSLEKGEGTDE